MTTRLSPKWPFEPTRSISSGSSDSMFVEGRQVEAVRPGDGDLGHIQIAGGAQPQPHREELLDFEEREEDQ